MVEAIAYTVAAALFTEAASVAIGYAVVSSALYVTAGLAIGAAQYALSKLLAPRPGGAPINDPGTTGNVRQATPPQRIVYGRSEVGGAVFFLDDSKPPFLYLGILISRRRISQFVSVKVGDVDLSFDTAGNCLTGSHTGKIRVSFRDGDPDQAIDPLLASAFPNLASTFRQRGIATAVFEFNYGADQNNHLALWGNVGIPNPLITIDGATVYDSRDPTQDRDDEETWKFSDNATLIQADWLRQPYGVNVASSRVDWDEVAAAANFDDELVALADGTFQKRHTINGVVTLDSSPRDVMEAMLTANRGLLAQSGGLSYPTSSKPQDPILVIHDGLLVGGFEYRDTKPKRDLVNKVTGRFIAQERDYQEVEGPIYDRTDLATEDGETLPQAVRLPLTATHQRFQRLAKQFLLESRLGKALTVTIKLEAMAQSAKALRTGRCIRVWSDVFPMINADYLINEWGFAEDFSSIRLSLVEYDRTIPYAWDAAVDEQAFTLPVLNVS